MGKRELLLIVAFAIVGVVLYQLNAPADREGRGFSLGRLIQQVRREVQGNQARAEHKTETTETVNDEVDELRVERVLTLALIGEDRDDIRFELAVTSTGFDTAEAEKLARETVLRLDASGRILTVAVDYPEGGRQSAALTIRLPARLRARVQGVRGGTTASGLRAVYLDGTRGDVTLERIAEMVEGSDVRGTVTGSAVGGVKLTARSLDLRLADVRGDVQLEMSGGTIEARRVGGAIEFEGRSTDLDVDGPSGAVRINATGGRATLRNIGQDVRFEGRGADLDLALARPATVTASGRGGTLRFTAPPTGGFTLDAEASGGAVRVSGLDLNVTREDGTERAVGRIRGGGPTVTLRATDGSVHVRLADPSD